MEAFHRSLALLEEELLLLQIDGGCQRGVLVFTVEITLNKVEGLLEDFLVLVALQKLQLVQT